MQRAYQLTFLFSLALVSWYAMMAVHELGHVLGAYATGGSVTKVVLHPLSISRTDVEPNPHPVVVVWLGPIVGCLLPAVFLWSISHRPVVVRNMARFFAGFCLVANGAYIGAGAWDQVGDCREMLRTGTPLSAMMAFGVIAVSLGLLVWQRLGSLGPFLRDPSMVHRRWAGFTLLGLVMFIAIMSLLSPRA